MTDIELEEKQKQLLNKIMTISLMMEGLWKYHPNNPDRKDITEDYDELLAEQQLVLNELDKIV